LKKTIIDSLEYAETPPQERKTVFSPRLTVKRFVVWIMETFNIKCCRETVRRALKKLGFSWKKYRKLLNKANPEEREAFVKKLAPILKEATHDERWVIYMDEAHIHLDTDEGYGWTIKGKRAWISSCSPGRKKVSFYGVYLYNQSETRIYPYLCADGNNTIDVLKKIRLEFPNKPITLIWDGASYHRDALVIKAAEELKITLEPLPAYSPDFMPVEHLWQWLREDVTYHTCYDDELELVAQVRAFEQSINSTPIEIADRLWTKTELNLDEEKLRFSK
jgi:transposase